MKEYLVVDEIKVFPVALTTSIYGEPPTNGKKEPLDNCVVIVFTACGASLNVKFNNSEIFQKIFPNVPKY